MIDPCCPYCDAVWPEGPEIRHEGGTIQIVYCGACGKTVAILPYVQHVVGVNA